MGFSMLDHLRSFAYLLVSGWFKDKGDVVGKKEEVPAHTMDNRSNK